MADPFGQAMNDAKHLPVIVAGPVTDTDLEAGLTAEDALEVYSLRLSAIKGKRPKKGLLRKRLTQAQLRLWHELAAVPALMLQDRLLHWALHGQLQDCLPCLGTGKIGRGPDERPCGLCGGKGLVRRPADPRIVKLAADAAIDFKDRLMGKATEKIQVQIPVQVVVGGVDPNRLPTSAPPAPVPLVEEDADDHG
jgi:hypothetical protein